MVAPAPASGPTLSDDTDPSEVDHRDPQVRRWLIDRPGPTWREWFYGPFAKTYLLLGLFIGDAIVLAYWLEPANLLGLVGSLLPLLYLEFLLYQYLWYDPEPEPEHRSRSTRRHASETPSRWLHPFAMGRWSATAARRRAGIPPAPPAPEGPDPHEFL